MKFGFIESLAFSLAIFLISFNSMAAPKILFKDVHHKNQLVKASVIPPSIHAAIKQLENKHPDLYQIVVYKYSDHYVLFLLSSKKWEMTQARIDIDSTHQVRHVIYPYQNVKELQSWEDEQTPQCPDDSVQFVAISAFPGIAAVDESIAKVAIAANKKYKTVAILNELADGQTYKNWLSCPSLKGFYSIGHGSPEGIIVGNGDVIPPEFFASPALINKYQSTTIVFNSCLVYNHPFGTQIMYGNALSASEYAENPGPNAYEYMGGHTNLLMYASERTSACFLAKAIEGAPMDYYTLQMCVGAKDLHYQNFGLSHPGRYFDSPSLKNSN